jgi:mannose-1-phosphate guanylyltransferase/mannose-1-phosphate guanylyltransferase/mannose-6-phosphate isomerase
VLLVAPSDHHIPDGDGFRAAVRAGIAAVERGEIVTFGIAPDRAETGYGYLELVDEPEPGSATVNLRRFVEKPDPAAARAMVASGRYLWNAGIFLGRARDIVAAFEAHAPDLLAPVRAAVADLRAELGFLRLEARAWAGARAVSIDYAVMEHARNLCVVPFGGAWSDLGDWDAIWRAARRDGDGVAASEGVTAVDCRDTLLRAQGGEMELVAIGLSDMVVVAMPDAVVVAPRARAQEVRAAVAQLKAAGKPQATAFAREHRPWGWFETVARGDRHKVKRIVVRPGGVLSLQSHVHRAEHWVVVSGTAQVTIGETVRLVAENESIYVPLGAMHRLENPGKVDLQVIEVQTGAYLGEDDITRYEDLYARFAAD